MIFHQCGFSYLNNNTLCLLKKYKSCFPWVLVPFSFELMNIQMLNVMTTFSSYINRSCYSAEEIYVSLCYQNPLIKEYLMTCCGVGVVQNT